MFPFKKITYLFLYIMLLSPAFSYLYTVVFHFPKTILHVYVFIVFIYGIIFLIFKNKIHFPKYLWFLFFYGIYRFVWILIANEQKHILTKTYESILYFSILFIIIIIYNINFSTKFIKRSILLFKITVILALIFTLIQVIDINFFNAFNFFNIHNYGYNIYRTRRTSMFGFVDLNELGLSFIPLLSILIGYMLKHKDKTYIYYLIMGGLIAFLSNNRYVMVSYIIITFQIIIYNKIKFSGLLKYFVISVVLFFIIINTVEYFGYNLQDWFYARLFAEGSITETTRYKALINFEIFFRRNMLFGTGVHLTEEIRKASLEIGSSQIHVGYLSHLVSYGIVGSIFLFGFWGYLLKNIYKNAKKMNYWGSFFAFLSYFWAQATLVNFSLFYTGLLYALVFDKYYKDIKFSNNHKSIDKIE